MIVCMKLETADEQTIISRFFRNSQVRASYSLLQMMWAVLELRTYPLMWLPEIPGRRTLISRILWNHWSTPPSYIGVTVEVKSEPNGMAGRNLCPRPRLLQSCGWMGDL